MWPFFTYLDETFQNEMLMAIGDFVIELTERELAQNPLTMVYIIVGIYGISDTWPFSVYVGLRLQ